MSRSSVQTSALPPHAIAVSWPAALREPRKSRLPLIAGRHPRGPGSVLLVDTLHEFSDALTAVWLWIALSSDPELRPVATLWCPVQTGQRRNPSCIKPSITW